jgi:DNA (cytosine-5)-methyltransferase 1
LTIRECARIQAFPDDYEFIISANRGNIPVSGSEAYKLIGNAVPPLLAYHIAKRVEKIWSILFNLDEDKIFSEVFEKEQKCEQLLLFEAC